MLRKLYLLYIATFNNKIGPLCIFTQNSEYCKFAERECNGFNCPLIIDSINSHEENFFIEKGLSIFQIMKFSLKNPSKRGEIDRYLIITKVLKSLGNIKEAQMKEIVEDLKNFIFSKNLEPSFEDFKIFQEKWEKILQDSFNLTALAEKYYYIRERLNIISGYLQILLQDAKTKKIEKDVEIITEILTSVFEIEDILS